MQVDRPARSTETSEWALTVVGGPSAGTRLAWDGAEVVLGRKAMGATLFHGDPEVSRRHAALRILDGTCFVEDRSSTNGTFINDVRIARPTVLGQEDELRIGSTRLRLAPAPDDTALLGTPSVLEPEAAAGDGRTGNNLTEPQPAGATGTPEGGPRVHKAGRLALTTLAAIAGTVLASALNGSPQLRLAAAVVGAAVPAFMTEPGRHQRARITAAAVLMAVGLFVTYGGATVFSYATDHAPVYPVPAVLPPPVHKATGKSSPTPQPTSPTPQPTSPTPPPTSPTPPFGGTSDTTPPTSPTPPFGSVSGTAPPTSTAPPFGGASGAAPPSVSPPPTSTGP